jgi:hypothetical protein
MLCLVTWCVAILSRHTLPYMINKLNEYLVYLLAFHVYFYWGF